MNATSLIFRFKFLGQVKIVLENCRYTYFVLKRMFSTNESNHVLILHMHDTDVNE